MKDTRLRMPLISDKERKLSRYVTFTGLPLKGLLLPDIELFKEVNRQYDKILGFLELSRVLKRVFISKPGGNEIFNRYLRRTWARLHKYAQLRDENRFMALADLMMKRSQVARILFLWRVKPTWYKSSSLRSIILVMMNLNRIIERKSNRFSFKRIRIPKSDGTLRPLAVPPLEWRVLSNWNNVLFTIWAHGTNIDLKPNQFGILKGGGLKGTWQEIIKRINKPYIYEFDLSKFFDLVPLYWVKRGLVHYKFPDNLITRAIETIRWSNTVLKKEKLLEIDQNLDKIHQQDERPEAWDMFRLKHSFDLNRMGFIIESVLTKGCPQEFHETYNEPFIDVSELVLEYKILNEEDHFWWNAIFNYVYVEKAFLPKKVISRLIYKDIDRIIKEKAKDIGKQHNELEGLNAFNTNLNPAMAKFNLVLSNDRIQPFTRGVPQGFGLSPMLSCFALYKVMDKWKDELVMYLDDGLIFSDTPIDEEKLANDFASIGVNIAPNKSGFVKINGKWCKNLKFLGLEYLPESGNIKANTKSGKNLELPALKFLENPELNKYFKLYTVKWLDSIRNKSNIEKWDAIHALGFGLNLIFRGRNEDKTKNKLSKNSMLNLLKIKESNKTSSELSKGLLELLRLKSKMNRAEFLNYLRKIKLRSSEAIR